MNNVTIDRLRVSRDARGFVFEPLDAVGLQQQSNVHIVWTEPGAIRGNHYHLEGEEVSAVAGPARVRYRSGASVQTVDVPDGEVWRFRFAAGVPHAFQNTGERVMMIASFNTVAHDPGHPDVVAEKLL